MLTTDIVQWTYLCSKQSMFYLYLCILQMCVSPVTANMQPERQHT